MRLLREQLADERAQREQQQRAFEQRLSLLEENQAAAALMSGLPEGGVEEYEGPRAIELYGFMDFGLQRLWIPKSSFYREVVGTNQTTFVLGNVNLYIDAHPDERWRALVEVRFSTLPHGVETALGGLGGGYQRTNTTVFDSSDVTGLNQVRYGSILLERAFIEWSYSDKLQIMGGQWFTPWGIWNIDHGSPTLITASLPLMILQQPIPRQQVGVQVLGRYNRPPWSLGYHAYVSNGRSAALVDYTDNKAVGGRLFLQYSGKSQIQIGTTGFWGRYDDIEKNVTSLEPLKVDIEPTVAMEEASVGLDFSLDIGKTRIRSEGLITWRKYDKGLRQQAILEPPGHYDSDRIRYNWYGIFAQRIGWFEPNLQIDLENVPTGRGDAVAVFGPGFNIYFSPASHLKVGYGYVHYFDLFENDGDHSVNDFQVAASRWVLAF